ADFNGDNDPGVQSVSQIYQHYKAHEYQTVVMGASFRNRGEIEALAGCDKLTISPELLAELESTAGELPRRLQPHSSSAIERFSVNELSSRWLINEDARAHQKLADGSRRFAAYQRLLEQRLQAVL